MRTPDPNQVSLKDSPDTPQLQSNSDALDARRLGGGAKLTVTSLDGDSHSVRSNDVASYPKLQRTCAIHQERPSNGQLNFGPGRHVVLTCQEKTARTNVQGCASSAPRGLSFWQQSKFSRQ